MRVLIKRRKYFELAANLKICYRSVKDQKTKQMYLAEILQITAAIQSLQLEYKMDVEKASYLEKPFVETYGVTFASLIRPHVRGVTGGTESE